MLIEILLSFAIIVSIFLVFREVACWYFKINTGLTALNNINRNLVLIRELLIEKDSPTGASGAPSGAENSPRAMPQDIHEAIRQGNLDIVRRLIAYGSDVDKADKSGKTPLDLAIEGNALAITNALLHGGAKIKHNLVGTSQIRRAKELGHLEIYNLLMRHELNRPT